MSDKKQGGTSQSNKNASSETSSSSATTFSSPYRLRDHSRMPSRYKDYINTTQHLEQKPSPSKIHKRTRPVNSPTKRPASSSAQQATATTNSNAKKSSTSHQVLQMDADNDDDNSADNDARQRSSTSANNSKRISFIKIHHSPSATQPQSRRTNNSLSAASSAQERLASASPSLTTAAISSQRRITRNRPPQADLTDSLKENLCRLKNVLKLPKARRWVYCEFFYSGVDRQLFLGDNEFMELLNESFPNLKCFMLRKPEWRTIRRLIGKPRRCSQSFLNEERAALEAKRQKIREIYEGSVVSLLPHSMDLPLKLPRPLIVGAKIYARVRQPKDGIYAGTIDAVLPDSYRVVFDKEEMIPPMIIKHSEVMSEQKDELLTLTYFLEQNRAAMPTQLMKMGNASIQNYLSSSPSNVNVDSSYVKTDPFMTGTQRFGAARRLPISIRDEKVGNFPVRMLVILVKLAKLIETKRTLIRQLADLNREAEKMNLLTNSYPYAFQERYAQLVVDIETLNKQMQSYLNAVNEYNTQLLPQLTEVPLVIRPDALRKLCQTHAVQIVKHCNNGLNVHNKRILNLITSLTALLLQVRSLGQQRSTALDLSTLSDSILDLRKQICSSNIASFQDNIEVHMKHIHNMMLNNGAF
ncbi:unnamed protein product [Anisakis simplex]|uniref:DIRP domain-containing protein n=1 Tax=Anisakis simplex TaxID=6269 RepID=A0A0M3JZQ2_ANISI|nr:unnamed protein product [Anisakis simplex]